MDYERRLNSERTARKALLKEVECYRPDYVFLIWIRFA